MNHDHTHNSFKTFVRRRGIGKQSNDDSRDTLASMPRRTSSQYHENRLPPLLPPTPPGGHTPQPSPLPQRTLPAHGSAAGFNLSADGQRSNRSGGNSSSGRSNRPNAAGSGMASGKIRRTRTGTSAPPSPMRSRRREEAPRTSPPPKPSSKKQYKCEYCDLDFGRKHHKERHVANIHKHVSPPMRCALSKIHSARICRRNLVDLHGSFIAIRDVGFLTLSLVCLHLRRYLQEKPFICDICSHPFHQKPNLDRHRATVHSETHAFVCEACGIAFSRRSMLKTHAQETHHNMQRHECMICREVFSVKRDLTAHIRSAHPGYPTSSGSSSSRGK